jgi:hypothetical protein
MELFGDGEGVGMANLSLHYHVWVEPVLRLQLCLVFRDGDWWVVFSSIRFFASGACWGANGLVRRWWWNLASWEVGRLGRREVG